MPPSAIIEMNGNLDSQLTGTCWGTFEWNLSGEEKWKGFWNGKFDLKNYIGSYHSTGHGQGGSLKGLKFKMDSVMRTQNSEKGLEILNWDTKLLSYEGAVMEDERMQRFMKRLVTMKSRLLSKSWP